MKAPEPFQACKAIFKIREVYTPETSCIKRTSASIKNMWINQLCYIRFSVLLQLSSCNTFWGTWRNRSLYLIVFFQCEGNTYPHDKKRTCHILLYSYMLLTWDMSSNHHCSTCFHQGCVCLECHSRSVFGWNCWPDGCFYRWKKNANHVSIVFKIFSAEILLMVTIHSIQYLFWKKLDVKINENLHVVVFQRKVLTTESYVAILKKYENEQIMLLQVT